MSAFDSPDRVYFFFDYISHNAYLAWCRLPALAQRHGLAITPVPVLFGALLSHYKQLGPAEVPAKSRWMLRNVLRKARLHGIPIAPPASHPFNPLVPLRVTCAEPDEGRQLELVDRLFRAAWAEGRAIAETDVVGALLADGGFDGARLLADAQTDAVKQRLRANTQAALDAGAFGVPTLLVRGSLFWGFDDLEYLDMVLGGRDPLKPDELELGPWLAVRPSIERRR